MTKRWLCVLLGLLLLLPAGCGKKQENPDPSGGTISTTTTATTQASTTTTTEKTTGTTIPARDLTAAERESIQEFLCKQDNNGFVTLGHYYASPQEVDLEAAFYNTGAGFGSDDTKTWAEGEKAAVQAALGWEEWNIPVLKITQEGAEQAVRQKLGIALASVEDELTEDFAYVEAYAAYYKPRSDTNYWPVRVTGGMVDGTIFTVYYEGTTGEDGLHTVVLRQTADGYQFVSNQKGKKG